MLLQRHQAKPVVHPATFPTTVSSHLTSGKSQPVTSLSLSFPLTSSDNVLTPAIPAWTDPSCHPCRHGNNSMTGESKAITALGWGQMYPWVLKSRHSRLIHKCGRAWLLESGCSCPFLHHLVKAEGPAQALTQLQLQAMLYKPARGVLGGMVGTAKGTGRSQG